MKKIYNHSALTIFLLSENYTAKNPSIITSKFDGTLSSTKANLPIP